MPTAALYARYSTDHQSDNSLEAQERICRARAEALGLTVVALHSDAAVSGSMPVERREGGRALLADALAHRFDVLIIEGLDRLSRDSVESERVVRRLEHRGIRIVGCTDGYDTASGKLRKLQRGMRGLINEAYVDDIRDKVHRSLSEKASRGCHVAGLSYGYRSEAVGDDRRLVIVEEQAAIVREIFARYGTGESCQRIAADLNARGVRGPRGGTWCVSALYGSPAKGAGVLNNELYIGRYVWNRSQWLKDPDTGKRTRMDRPRSEWQRADVLELRIVDDDAWRAVRGRMARTKNGRPSTRQGIVGKTLFGGILRCGVCGGSMIAVDAYKYGCAARKDRGRCVCPGVLAPRKETDSQLLAAIRHALAGPDAIAQVRAAAAEALADQGDAQTTARTRIAALQREIERLADAVAQMGLSAALRARLEAAERELEQVTARARRAPAKITADDVVGRYRENLLRLLETMQRDVTSARAALAQCVGEIRVKATDDGVFAEMQTRPELVMLESGGAFAAQFGCGGAQPDLEAPTNQIDTASSAAILGHARFAFPGAGIASTCRVLGWRPEWNLR